MGSIPVRVTKEVPAHPRRNFFDGYPYGNRKTGPEGAVNMPVAYSPGRGRFPPERTSREEASSDDGGERSLPGVTKEVPAHPRRNFFDGYPQGNRRAVPGALETLRRPATSARHRCRANIPRCRLSLLHRGILLSLNQRNAGFPAGKIQKPRLRPRFLQQERGEEKMKKIIWNRLSVL